ncbi:MAG: hypothetical protein HY035_00155 [Nitrospirae bacterium]|nr:hypothetical protein [Nitrospirota bacterium]MBI3376802.1 hypothetical protein [Nitrospirota bacterium]
MKTSLMVNNKVSAEPLKEGLTDRQGFLLQCVMHKSHNGDVIASPDKIGANQSLKTRFLAALGMTMWEDF